MTSNRPYLIRALQEWLTDNGLTPHILVDASHTGVDVPNQFIEDGKVVLNISGQAVKHLQLGNEWIEFEARFAGQPETITVPLPAVIAIYARENGQGMMFAEAEQDLDQAADSTPDSAPDSETRITGVNRGSHLKIIK